MHTISNSYKVISGFLLFALLVFFVSDVRVHSHHVAVTHQHDVLDGLLTSSLSPHQHHSAPHLSIDGVHENIAGHHESDKDLTPKGVTKKLTKQQGHWVALNSVGSVKRVPGLSDIAPVAIWLLLLIPFFLFFRPPTRAPPSFNPVQT